MLYKLTLSNLMTLSGAGYKTKRNEKSGPGSSMNALETNTHLCTFEAKEKSMDEEDLFRFQKTTDIHRLSGKKRLRSNVEDGRMASATLQQPTAKKMRQTNAIDLQESSSSSSNGMHVDDKEGDSVSDSFSSANSMNVVDVGSTSKDVELGVEEEKEKEKEEEVTIRALGHGVDVSFDRSNRRPVVAGTEHSLAVTVNNRGGTPTITVVVGFSGIACDYRGIPLVRTALRSGNKVPWRVVMKGQQTVWYEKRSVHLDASETISLTIPANALANLQGGSNKIIRWTLSTTIVVGEADGGGDERDDMELGDDEEVGSVDFPPPVHEFNARLVN